MTVWQLDFARADGFAGFVRLEVEADAPRAWYGAYLVGVPDVPGVVVVRDDDVPRPRQGLEIRSEGLWAELHCETPEEHWSFGLEAFAIVLDDPAAALAPGGEIGDRIPVGFDLEWEAGAAGGDDVVHGEVLVGAHRYDLDAAGRFLVDAEPPAVDGPVVATVVVRDRGYRDLVADAGYLRWAPLLRG